MDNDETQVAPIMDEPHTVSARDNATAARPGAGHGMSFEEDFPDIPASFVTRREQLGLREKREKKKGKGKKKNKKNAKGKGVNKKVEGPCSSQSNGKLRKLRRMRSSRSNVSSSPPASASKTKDAKIVKSAMNAKPKAKGKANAKAKAGSGKPSRAPAACKKAGDEPSKASTEEAPKKRVRAMEIEFKPAIRSKAQLKGELHGIFKACAAGTHAAPVGIYGAAPVRLCPYKHKGHFGVKIQKREGDGPIKWCQPYYISPTTPCQHACALQVLGVQIVT